MSFLAKIVEVSFLVHLNAADMVAWLASAQGVSKAYGTIKELLRQIFTFANKKQKRNKQLRVE